MSKKKVPNTKKRSVLDGVALSIGSRRHRDPHFFIQMAGACLTKFLTPKNAQFLMIGLCSASMERSVLSGCRLTRSPPPAAVNSRLLASVNRVWDRLYNTPSPTVHTWTVNIQFTFCVRNCLKQIFCKKLIE
jgi:hypothetical protein